MATYYDALNDFHKLNEQEPLASSAQLVYLHLLHLNNRLGNSGHVQVSDRELEHRTKLNKKTITEAKRILKNRDFIDFKTDKGKPRAGTAYTLTFFSEKVGQNLGQNLGQKVGQNPLSPRLRSRFLEKTKDGEKKTPPLPPQGGVEGATETATGAEVVHAPEVDSSDVFAEWAAEMPRRLNDRQWCELQTMAENYGLEKVKAAIKKVADTRRYPTFEDVKAVLEGNYTKSQTPKGGEKSERNGRFDGKIDYGEEPDYSWIKRPK